MKKKKLIINILACLVSFVTVLGINFFLTPYITENVGTDAYGFVSLANNFVNYASIITLAINSMASRFISVSIFQKKQEEASKYFTSVLFANIILILILFIPMAICIFYLDKMVTIPSNLIPSVKILFSLIFFNFFLSLINSTYSVSTYASDRMELYTLRNMESSILKVAVMCILFYVFDASIIVIGISTILATLYQLFFNIIYKRKFLSFLKIRKKYFDIKKIIEIFLSGIWNTIIKIGQVLSDGLDLFIANIFISPIAMGQLSIAKTISSSVNLLTMSLSSIFQPNMTKLYANDSDEFADNVKFSMKVVSFFSNILLIGIICFGIHFYKLWLPNEDYNLLNILTIITLLGCIVGTCVNPLFSIFTITNKLKVNSLVTFFTGFFTVLLVFIILKLNLISNPIFVVASVSVIIGIIKNLTFIPIYSAKCIGAKKTTFYEPIIKSLISSAMMAIVFFIFSKIFIIDSWLKLIIIASICGIIGGGISFIILFSKEEFKRLAEMLKKKILSGKRK